MSALLDFVHERLAEERQLIGRHRLLWQRLTAPERRGEPIQPGDSDGPTFAALELLGLDPFRWATAVAHLEAVVDLHGPDSKRDTARCWTCAREFWPCQEIRVWAARWRSHPRYRPEWTPTDVVLHFVGETS